METLSLTCSCGEVRGEAHGVSASSGNRVVCCCSDCQAFVAYLNAQAQKTTNSNGDQRSGSSRTLDEFGGTEIYQLPLSHVTITQGHEHLQSMRLQRKGLLRWYTGCCHTPIGNSISAKMPFFGVIHSFMQLNDRNASLGPVKSVVQTQHALGDPNYSQHSAKFPLSVTLKIIFNMLVWRIQGKHKPSAFFNEQDGRPVVKPIIVSEVSDSEKAGTT